MASHTQAEVQAALNYLCTGNNGSPLNWDQFVWELNLVNGTAFGECLTLAAKNPGLFPDVLTAPYMLRCCFPVQNVIDGKIMAGGTTSSWNSDGAPARFIFSQFFRNGVLAG